MKELDYLKEELALAAKLITVEQVIAFQSKQRVEIVVGEDWQYYCYINKEVFYIALTFWGALCMGIYKYMRSNGLLAAKSKKRNRFKVHQKHQCWGVFEMECDICTHEYVCVAPCRVKQLECPNCGAMN